jgi:hypothetical protein
MRYAGFEIMMAQEMCSGSATGLSCPKAETLGCDESSVLGSQFCPHHRGRRPQRHHKTYYIGKVDSTDAFNSIARRSCHVIIDEN